MAKFLSRDQTWNEILVMMGTKKTLKVIYYHLLILRTKKMTSE